MMKKNHHLPTKVIEAAGGVLWKETQSGFKLAIIHRHRYDDWSLPKGKRKPGESWQEAALREVQEETGCHPILGNFIGSTSYLINRQTIPKVVLFWQMYRIKNCNFRPTVEVDRLKWVSPGKALQYLNYEDEKNIINLAIQQLNGKHYFVNK